MIIIAVKNSLIATKAQKCEEGNIELRNDIQGFD